MKKRISIFTKYFAGAVCCYILLCIMASYGAAEPVFHSDKRVNQEKHTRDTIVVTAEKRATPVQKTPMSIVVFTQQDLEDQNIRTIRDVLSHVSNLMQVTDLIGNTKISLRGAIASSATETSPLVMYVDGVPVDSYAFLDANLLDIERIEVLRGGQSAIYGKNAFAGVVNIISKKPDNTSKGRVFVDGGSEYSHGMGGTVNGPVIKDKLFFSLSGSHGYRNGYMEPGPKSSESNHERNVRLNSQLYWLATDAAQIRFHLGYTQLREGPRPYMVGETPTLDSVAYGTDHKNVDVLNLALHGSVDGENMTMKSISTFRRDILTASLNTKPSFVSLGIGNDSNYDDTSSEITQEFRIQSLEGADVAWLAGIYGGYKDFNRKQFDSSDDEGNQVGNYPYKEETYEFAPFAQVVAPLFFDGLHLTAGFRWQYIKRDAILSYQENNGQDLIFQAQPSETWSKILPRLVLSYDITDAHMIYAGVNKGFLPGGFNRYTPSYDIPYTYDPQFAWNYEVGAKTSWLDRRLNANLTLFYSSYTDMHVQQWDQSLNNGMGATRATNAAEVTSYGAELELDAQVFKGLRAMLSLGCTRAEYDDFQTQLYGGLPVDYSGNKVESIPEYTGNASLLYRHTSGIICQAGLLYSGKIYWGADNTNSRGAVTRVNAKVGYEADSFDVYLYATNLFDERYTTAYIPGMFTCVGASREFGLRLVYRW